MRLSGHQPVYLPGIIVFNKIALSDAFMLVGHCDYQPKSWHSHNFIRGKDGPLKLTVPVIKGQSINETMPFKDGPWRRKHIESIAHSYGKRPYFNYYFPFLRDLIELVEWASLADLNASLMRYLAGCLDIGTHFLTSENHNIAGHKTEMLIDMCRKTGAGEYLSSPGETYVDQEQMKAAGIKHHFQKFTHPVYDQGHKDFIPDLSIIDLLFNCGPESGRIVKEAGYVG